ncbi:MAG: hypothetical protein FH747_06810 [Stenotrophomonas sp.]|uniref:hypothetical protein n=1 Tax=Stenotrophomonas sp. TaxID=69392 RepID=UPI0013521F0B|nr:hypothetical protein [Stenotrophomonas sp.]MTI73358.1 hypothetical protein [Stenotrophomonas sp.]
MGGKSGGTTVGYWYEIAIHFGLGIGPFDEYLEFRGGDKTAWSGSATHSQSIQINAPNLWGGEKDQGGIVGTLDLMFGEADQQPSARLAAIFGAQQPAWRGLATAVFAGRYGAMNPYPQKASHMIRKIKAGWDGECWYPEKAEVPLGGKVPEFTVRWVRTVNCPHTFNVPADVAGWSSTPGDYDTQQTGTAITWPTGLGATGIVWMMIEAPGGVPEEFHLDVKVNYDDSGKVIGTNGVSIGPATAPPNIFEYPRSEGIHVIVPRHVGSFVGYIAIACVDGRDIETGAILGSPSQHRMLVSSTSVISEHFACNAAHMLYYARTHSGIGRVPTARMNDASYRAAADKLHAEGFGICTSYDPSSESLDEFEQRICRLIGGSVSRSLVDGQYYLDLARGDYVLDELPIITDDDILDIKLQPSVPNGAINSVAVKYFDPLRKESITTPPVQALSLIDAFGVISQVNDYPEIPAGPLALRVAERDVRASTAPTRTMELTLIPDAVQGIRPNQYFRLQSAKRRITDMVCLMGDRQAGTLKSGAVRITATEDIYSLPATSFAEIEPGVDTRPDPTPNPITLQAAFEAPYIELVQRLDRANLDVLPPDAGYLLAVADQPPGGRSYSLVVAAAGGEFETSATGEWCPFATVSGDATVTYGPGVTAIKISAIQRGEQLVIGAAALWDSEIVRIDAIDIVASEVVLGRGCADTVAAEHAGGSLLWLYDAAAVSDLVEYTDGEVIDVKLLTNTGSAQLAPSAAAAMAVEFAGRQARPYPPAAPRLNGEAWPAEAFETADVSWLHRDRVAQADQLVDQGMASIGPEPGTTYTVRWFLNGVLVNTAAGIAGTSASFVPAADGALRVEIEAQRDTLTSWQMQVIECLYRTSHYSTYIDQVGDTYVDQDGNHYIG